MDFMKFCVDAHSQVHTYEEGNIGIAVISILGLILLGLTTLDIMVIFDINWLAIRLWLLSFVASNIPLPWYYFKLKYKDNV